MLGLFLQLVLYENVLLIEEKGKTTIGTPSLDKATVSVSIVDHLKGDKVIVAAQPTGIQFFGGFSEYLKVSDKYVEKLPAGLSLKKSMASIQ